MNSGTCIDFFNCFCMTCDNPESTQPLRRMSFCCGVLLNACNIQAITGNYRCDLRQYSWIYTDNSDFILMIKWLNSVILEPRICQLKTLPSGSDCQITNLISRHHLPIYSMLINTKMKVSLNPLKSGHVMFIAKITTSEFQRTFFICKNYTEILEKVKKVG